jgi:hypothetical protein
MVAATKTWEEGAMIPAALPFDYLRHIDRGDRIRRSRARASDKRVRRGFAPDAG